MYLLHLYLNKIVVGLYLFNILVRIFSNASARLISRLM